MNSGPPALEASTIPLGYRGGGPAVSKTKNAHLCRNKLNLKYCAIINVRGYEWFVVFVTISLRGFLFTK